MKRKSRRSFQDTNRKIDARNRRKEKDIGRTQTRATEKKDEAAKSRGMKKLFGSKGIKNANGSQLSAFTEDDLQKIGTRSELESAKGRLMSHNELANQQIQVTVKGYEQRIDALQKRLLSRLKLGKTQFRTCTFTRN
eukprot:TRINITY_DN11413_c0_g1_i1.p1 TRINITY_DN11413_c0_g1~~TRINITY_DN11413_c0_g1_i1.p1  ORF type:complete len:137 (-),score=20.35 TRINITY_DN11413_c0_g1_i1:10-420(-)